MSFRHRPGCGCTSCSPSVLRSAPGFYCFSVEQRYCAPFEQLKQPDGYDFTGEFRPAKQGEYFLFKDCGPVGVGAHLDVSSNRDKLPVLILRKRPKRKRIIFEETNAPLDNSFELWAEKTGYIGKLRPEWEGPGPRFTRREEEF